MEADALEVEWHWQERAITLLNRLEKLITKARRNAAISGEEDMAAWGALVEATSAFLHTVNERQEMLKSRSAMLRLETDKIRKGFLRIRRHIYVRMGPLGNGLVG